MGFLKTLALSSTLLLPTMAAADWNGFYLGGSLGFANLEFVGDSTVETETHNPFGIFLGYQLQSGEYVYGVEYSVAAAAGAQFEGIDGDFDVAYGDLKGRLGFDAGQYLPYALVSYSVTALDDGIDDVTADGLGFGVGIDYAVSESFVVGGEFITRSSDGSTINDVETDLLDVNSSSLSVRASFKF